eukprot:2302048-Rhodomonas_salina.1
MLDGHFVPTCRPGGDGNVNELLHDFQCYAGKERLHCLKFLSMVTPAAGVNFLWGPYTGNRHDSAMLQMCGLLVIMEE